MSEIIYNKKDLKNWLKYEKKRTDAKGGLLYFLQVRENEILYKHLRLLRFAEYHKNSGHIIRFRVAHFKLLKFQNRYALHIPLNVCGRGLKIMHLGPILINGRAKIGTDCTLHMNTGIVAGGTSNDAPIIGNNVVIGIGAILLGKIAVADNVAIGANAVVNRDILEENTTYAGVPAKMISHHGSLFWNLDHEEVQEIES